MASNSTPRSSAPYTSRIIKAGALIGDTKTLLAHWELDATVDENLSRVRLENVFGKASRSRVEDILGIFRQRYLSEPAVTKSLVTLVRGKFQTSALDRLFGVNYSSRSAATISPYWRQLRALRSGVAPLHWCWPEQRIRLCRDAP